MFIGRFLTTFHSIELQPFLTKLNVIASKYMLSLAQQFTLLRDSPLLLPRRVIGRRLPVEWIRGPSPVQHHVVTTFMNYIPNYS